LSRFTIFDFLTCVFVGSVGWLVGFIHNEDFQGLFGAINKLFAIYIIFTRHKIYSHSPKFGILDNDLLWSFSFLDEKTSLPEHWRCCNYWWKL